jgi:hypothetical protein
LGPLDLVFLQTVTGSFSISSNNALGSLDLPFLSTAGSLSISSHVEILNINLTSLSIVTAGDFTLSLNSALATISLPSLTYTEGHTVIINNAVLARINFPELSTVVRSLNIYSNPFLTFANLPQLTFIGATLGFCQNNAVFRIPSGPPNAPTGGLVVTGSYKGQPWSCWYQQGSGACTGAYCP